ncbi:MAG TPA: C4-type zinc ribbon domain-containing protein [Actinomycetota bacterium]
MKGLDRLLELQELDLTVDRLVARREELASGAALRGSRLRTEQLEEQVGELGLALDSVRSEQTRLETEVASLEAKIGAEERRLFDGSVANPKELESIQAEVGGLKNRKGRVEDELLGQMERREEMEDRLPALGEQLAEARRVIDDLETSSEREVEDIGVSLEKHAGERAALVTELDGDLHDLYEDLRSSKKGVGAAALIDGVCQGCHQKLSPLELDRLKRVEGLRRCEYCRRILVVS